MRGLLCEGLPTDFSRGLGIGLGTCPTRERGVTGKVPRAKVDPVIHSMYLILPLFISLQILPPSTSNENTPPLLLTPDGIHHELIQI